MRPSQMGGAAVGGAQDHLEAMALHDIHGTAEPGEIIFPFFGFAETPGELAEADDVHAGLDHQFGIDLPAGFRFFGGSSKGVNPMLGVVVGSEVHKL